ncbi:uncharacterized protein L3040_007186 [Drepanopeziza brunnea f. sp. 'multigermtubi']|uniref:AGA1 A-agglutinin anchor subunit n=1 Tax=Marssonina brunnea f. sp. multigermtubi (strain MB_m1) TaxID=1072389 RepID=K1Y4Y8_MARBU|nr:uncharacterized protein MBM_02141 [Drepanopeziza brunnea f. sp. 'multigermtubi' MB_m1]EKD20189.1 hypothetical protein MBM_02141 [Drepanopeziza brunnea f. sp. 'multigermtubi' MB_m1]KAJ5038320.1 hypothetical protein L3040_007186 [Drepanopeziza brunnea f. sp. 'multigermtubi']
MSAIPSRTKSLRHAGAGISQGDRSNVALDPEGAVRGSQSPSRLPVKPPATRTTRSTSTSAAGRPPSATGSISSYASTMRPPPGPPRAGTSKPATTGGLQRSTSNRRSNPPPVTAESEPAKKDRSRPPIVSRRLHNYSTSSFPTSTTNPPSHTRTRSSSTLSSLSTAPPPSKRNSVEIPRLQPSSKRSSVEIPRLLPSSKRSSVEVPRLPPLNSDAQLKKQTFSTYQQHFSPAKNLGPKPLTAAYLAPPSPSKLPSNIAISAETARLQNELLQLHLLHRHAGQVEKEWKTSAKLKLEARFHSIVDMNEKLLQVEIEETGKINALAIKSWQDLGAPGWGLEGKIQALDEVVTGVWNLGESGGKYSRIVRKFEKWLRRCQDIMEARAHGEGLDGAEVVFLDELDKAWKDDCLAIGRKLEAWKNRLRELGTPDRGSSLSVVVAGCRSLVGGMLAELSTMAQIERDAMRMEVEWITSINNEMMDDKDDTPVAGAIWRSR